MEASNGEMRLLLQRETGNGSDLSKNVGRPIGTGSFVSSISLAMIAITVVSFCLARRLVSVRRLGDMPLARWCLLLQTVFVFFCDKPTDLQARSFFQ